MDENLTPHFSKKILFLSTLFLLVTFAWYVLAVFNQAEEVYRSVAPKIVFAAAHDIQIKTLYDTDFHSAVSNQQLIAGTRIKTGELQYAEIILENNVVRLDENTEVTLKENNFSEYSTYEADLPRLAFGLDSGSVWVNAFDRIEIGTAQSSAQFSHSVGIVTYTEPMNRVMVVTGSADLALYDANGKLLITYAVPLHNQVAYTDNQIVPDYARLRPSKLKKELKLAPITKSILEDAWVVRNTAVDRKLVKDKIDLIDSGFSYSLKDKYYRARAYLTFIPQTQRQLTLEHADLMLRYLLGGIHSTNDREGAERILGELDALISAIPDDPSVKELFTETFQSIGTVGSKTPAYLVKEHLLKYIFSQDGPQVLRTYLADLKTSLDEFELEEARITAETWLDKWGGKEAEKNIDEFTKQSEMLHRIFLSYADRVTFDMLAVFDRTGQMRLDTSSNSEETRFVMTEERLEISSALVAAYRYLAAKQYLRTSYESLGIDKLDTKLASREIFLEQAKLLAQRIEYAEDAMHGAAAAIDETEFREYMQQKTRDELLSENLKAFLEIGKEAEIRVEPPTISEVIGRFTNARVNVSEADIITDEDSPFTFEIKTARLIDRTSDGSIITFSAVYDFTTNAVNDVVTKDMSLKGSFELNDLVAILTQNHLGAPVPEEPEEDISYLLGEESDEALRAQITAQNLAKQLLMNEFEEAGIIVVMDQIEVLDPVTLTRFRIIEAFVENPMDKDKAISISFEYDSSTKKASGVYSDGKLMVSGTTIDKLADTVLSSVAAFRQQAYALEQFQAQLKEKSLTFKDITADGLGRVEFKDLKLTTLPLSVDGVYDLNKQKIISVSHELYSAENITIETYFTELAYLFIVDYFEQKGLPVARSQITMSYPFQTIKVSDYELDGQTFSFFLDISAGRLRNVTLLETGASVDSITIEEFLTIAPQSEEEEGEEAEGE